MISVPPLRRQGLVDLCGFKAILIYIVLGQVRILLSGPISTK